MSRSFAKIITKTLSFLPGIFIFLAMNVTSLSVKSQDIKSLTLQATIDLSLKNSHILKASSAKIEEAAAQVKQEEDNKLPNASVSASYLYLANPNLDLKTKAFNGGGLDTSSNKGGIPHVNQAMYGIFNVSLPIYTGGKIRYGIESAKYLEQAVKFDADNDKQAIILNTMNS